MVASNTTQVANVPQPEYDRVAELKAFDDTKAGVKGLVDSGITKVPRIFTNANQLNLEHNTYPIASDHSEISSLPLIDLKDVDTNIPRRLEIIEEIMDASAKCGVFQVVNHCIPVNLMDEMIEATKMFHEQDNETKKQFYTRDLRRATAYNSNMDLFHSDAAGWKDFFQCYMAQNQVPDYQSLPPVCRDKMLEYAKPATELGVTLLELISEGLGLEPNYLKDKGGCADGVMFGGHYYPACPEPEMTMGLKNHTDVGFITLLVQDQVGGLQVLVQNKWAQVQPLRGAVIVIIGELMQLMSNDKLKCVHHRVLAQKSGPRLSISNSFHPHILSSDPKIFKPIEELLSEDNPPHYKGVTMREYIVARSGGFYGNPPLTPFMLQE